MNIFKNFSMIAVTMFLIGSLITVIYMFNLPGQLSTVMPAIGSNWENLKGVFYTTYAVIGFELALGIGAIILLIIKAQNSDNVKIVYVDKYSTNKKEEEATIQSVKVEDTLADIEVKVKNIKSILNGKGDLKKLMEKTLSSICNQLEASQGAIYFKAESNGKRVIRLFASFAYNVAESDEIEYEFGEGLTGQAAKEGKLIKLNSVPEGYIKIFSGLGNATPSNLVFVPIKKGEECVGVMEISSFKGVTAHEEEFLVKLSEVLSEYVVNHKELIGQEGK